MPKFYVYFIGTTNGRWIEALTMSAAKRIFCKLNDLPERSSYVKASKVKPH